MKNNRTAITLLKSAPVIFLTCIVSAVACSQNLVPNPSFETKTSCPTGNSQLTLAVPWVLPPGSITTPDYFNACVSSGADCNYVDVPKNFVGKAPAASGLAYAGIITLYDFCFNCREYIQIKLNTPLTAGVQYQAEMHVRPGSYNKYLTNNMGMYISTNAVSQPSNQPITSVTPQINYASIIDDTSKWTLVTGFYTASGGEQYLTIGNFFDNSNTLFNTVSYPGGTCALVTGGAMYLIDSVFIGIPNFQLPPSAAFYSIQNQTCSQTCLDFTDESANNPTAWQWTFDGGTPGTSTLQNPNNICYDSSGNYQITLIVSNAAGNDTIVMNTSISVLPTPTVSVTQSNDTLFATGAVTYQWFINGNPINGATNVYYLPPSEGSYVVVIADSNGCTSSDTIYFVLSPLTAFSGDKLICQKFCTNYFDQSQNNPTSWKWTFEGGNPATSLQQNPVGICYNTPGAYDVTLIAYNAYGSDTLSITDYITVFATPPLPVITQNGYILTCSPAATYQWQLNSNDIAGATNQSYTVLQTGFYTVIISDENGCISSTTLYVLVTSIESLAIYGNPVVYPNPSQGNFVIDFGTIDLSGDFYMEVINAIGQKVFSDQIKVCSDQYYTNLVNVADGVYSLVVKNASLLFQFRIVVQK